MENNIERYEKEEISNKYFPGCNMDDNCIAISTGHQEDTAAGWIARLWTLSIKMIRIETTH